MSVEPRTAVTLAIIGSLAAFLGCGPATTTALRPTTQPAPSPSCPSSLSPTSTPRQTSMSASPPATARTATAPPTSRPTRTATTRPPVVRPPVVRPSASQPPTRTATPVSTYFPPGPLAPVVKRISTTRRIVFVTIDDGWTRDPALPSDLAKAGVPTSLFLVGNAAKLDYSYFRQLQRLGATIEDHTLTHPDCTRLSYAEQRQQICTAADTYHRVFGRRPTLLRPPYGDFNSVTQRAAQVCGMHALVNWDVSVNSGRLSFASGHQLRPGDIILMHFTPNIRRDFAAALAAARQQGFTVRRLEDYL